MVCGTCGFMYLVMLWIIAHFFICLCCEHFQHISVFAVHLFICLCCEYLQCVFVFASSDIDEKICFINLLVLFLFACVFWSCSMSSSDARMAFISAGVYLCVFGHLSAKSFACLIWYSQPVLWMWLSAQKKHLWRVQEPNGLKRHENN